MTKRAPEYVIQATRYWYGPRETRELVWGQEPLVFRTRVAAEAYADRLYSRTYYLANNESRSPDYEVRAVSRLSHRLQHEVAMYGVEPDA